MDITLIPLYRWLTETREIYPELSKAIDLSNRRVGLEFRHLVSMFPPIMLPQVPF